MPQAIRALNWVDLFVIILLIRICYVAAKSGFPAEIFKLLGTLSAICLGFHYYSTTSEYLVGWLKMKEAPLFLNSLTFLFLSAGGYLIFFCVRRFFSLFIKMEATALLNKWGGMVVGVFRALLLSSLILCILTISGAAYFKRSVEVSYSGARIINIAPNVYSWSWKNIISRFLIPGEAPRQERGAQQKERQR